MPHQSIRTPSPFLADEMCEMCGNNFALEWQHDILSSVILVPMLVNIDINPGRLVASEVQVIYPQSLPTVTIKGDGI